MTSKQKKTVKKYPNRKKQMSAEKQMSAGPDAGLSETLKAKVFRFLKIVTPLFVCGVLLGLGLGKHWSRNYDDPAEIAKYVAANVKQVYGQTPLKEQFTQQGQLVARTPLDSDLYFECEISGYTYTPGKPLPPPAGILEHDRKTHRQSLDFEAAMALIYGSVEGLKLATRLPKFLGDVEKLNLEERIKYSVAGALAFGSGVALGVKLGFEDSPNCTSNVFSEKLKDEHFWQAVYKEYQATHSIFITYDDLGFPRIDKSQGIGAILDSNKRTDLITLFESRPQLREMDYDLAIDHMWLAEAITDVHKGFIPRFWICENQLARLDPRRADSWEMRLSPWAKRHGPVAARILVDRRFKGDIMVVLRRWEIGEGVKKYDFVSSPDTKTPEQLERELDSLNWPNSKYYVRIEKRGLLDMNF
jgi:hypothetical protein